MNTLVYMACAVLLLGYPLVWWMRGRGLHRIFERASSMARDRIQELQLELERAREVAQAERDKSSRYFTKISDFERERDDWQKRYTLQSIGHGNAQSLMMQTIDGMARQLQSKGVKVKIPKVLHAVREEFLATHELPARQLEAEIKDRQQSSAPAEPPQA